MRLIVVLLVLGVVFGVFCRESYSQNFQQIGGKYYYIEHNDKLDWSGARDECESMDAHLVSIQNYREWHSITDHLTVSKSYWVDLRDVNSTLNFMSDTSGRKAPFLKWSHGQPRSKKYYECVKLRARSHSMKTKYCSQENHYICEADSHPVSHPVTSAPIEHYPSSRYEIVDMSAQRNEDRNNTKITPK